jgi:ubiquinone biosynthesis protein Coq4
MPEHWKKMRSAFRLGKKAIPMHDWAWNDILEQKTIDLRNKIFNQS